MFYIYWFFFFIFRAPVFSYNFSLLFYFLFFYGTFSSFDFYFCFFHLFLYSLLIVSSFRFFVIPIIPYFFVCFLSTLLFHYFPTYILSLAFLSCFLSSFCCVSFSPFALTYFPLSIQNTLRFSFIFLFTSTFLLYCPNHLRNVSSILHLLHYHSFFTFYFLFHFFHSFLLCIPHTSAHFFPF